jgi:altronate dehydratase
MTLQLGAGTTSWISTPVRSPTAATIEEVRWELFRLMLEVASGRKKTLAEHHRLHNALVLFNPAPVT